MTVPRRLPALSAKEPRNDAMGLFASPFHFVCTQHDRHRRILCNLQYASQPVSSGDFSQGSHQLDAGDMPAERMVVEATWPVEEAVRAVPGVLRVRSNTSRGSADISINFVWETRYGIGNAASGIGH